MSMMRIYLYHWLILHTTFVSINTVNRPNRRLQSNFFGVCEVNTLVVKATSELVR